MFDGKPPQGKICVVFISTLLIHIFRHTATRKTRLEDLRKGKAVASSTSADAQRDANNKRGGVGGENGNASGIAVNGNENQKRKSLYRKGRRGVSRKQRVYEDNSDEEDDTGK